MTDALAEVRGCRKAKFLCRSFRVNVRFQPLADIPQVWDACEMKVFLLGFVALLSPSEGNVAEVQPTRLLSSSAQSDEPSTLSVGLLTEMEARLEKLGRCVAEAMFTSKSLIAVELVEHAYGSCDLQTVEVREWFSNNNAPRTFNVVMDGLRARSLKLAKNMEARARAEGVPLRW